MCPGRQRGRCLPGPGRSLFRPGTVLHNLDHIAAVLALIDRLRDQAYNLPAVQLAAWFHDVVYDTQAADNEEQSAAYARRVLTDLGLPTDLAAHVAALILATKTTRRRTPTAPSCWMLTWRSWAPLRRRTSLVCYGHPPGVCLGAGSRLSRRRVAVLQTFLDRDRIYHTAPMFATHENPARRNLRAELAALDER